MKNAMLFCIALLFSVSASAATLNLSTVSANGGANQEVTVNNNSTVLAGGTVSSAGSWESLFDVVTNVDTPVRVEWSFNPSTSLQSAQLVFGQVNGFGGGFIGPTTIFNITGDFIFTAVLTAGAVFGVDIINATSGILEYDLSISAVPVPAALWLFAPALMGFFGLRRKAKKMEMAVA